MDKPTYTRTCLHCGNEFQAQIHNAKFCSDSHKWSYHTAKKREKRAVNLGLVDETNNIGTPSTAPIKTELPKRTAILPTPGIDIQTQTVINLLTKEADRFEDEAKKYKEKWEKILDEKTRIEREFDNFKRDKEIESIKDAKPGGLRGFAETDSGKELLQHIGPALGRFADKILNPPTTLPEHMGDNDEVTAWVQSQSEEIKNALRGMIAQISTIQDQQKILAMIGRLSSVMKNGSAIIGSNLGTGTWG